jgi:HEAT repeat protein
VRNVVGILGDIGDVSVLPRLRGVFQHSDPRVRREAVRTLSRFVSDPGCIEECEEMIIAALEDDDRGVQTMAINALATSATPRRMPALLELARRAGPHTGASVEVRQEAIAALGKIGSVDAVPALTEILTRKGLLGHQEPTELRAAAVKALAGIKSAGARKLVTETAQKDPRQAVREAAAAALQGQG